MKKAGLFILILMIGFILSSFVLKTEKVQDEKEQKLSWYTDLDKVHDLSAESGRPVFGFFTGSDWCGWCHKLQREVFAKSAFIEWAEKNVILLEVDFPRKKQLPEKLATQNKNLQQAFGVSGYPTVWIFNTTKDESDNYNLTALGKLGYPRGAEAGKEEVKFINDANAILALGDKSK